MIDYDQIVTSTEIIDDIEITTIEVPNEHVAQWKQENNWEDSSLGEINQLVETSLHSRGASAPAVLSKCFLICKIINDPLNLGQISKFTINQLI